MIDERASIRDVLIGMLQQPDGVTVYLCTAASIFLLAFNVLFPALVGHQYGDQGKWIAVWLVEPLLTFLWYVKLRQLVEGETLTANVVRSTSLLFLFIALVYFNFK